MGSFGVYKPKTSKLLNLKMWFGRNIIEKEEVNKVIWYKVLFVSYSSMAMHLVQWPCISCNGLAHSNAQTIIVDLAIALGALAIAEIRNISGRSLKMATFIQEIGNKLLLKKNRSTANRFQQR